MAPPGERLTTPWEKKLQVFVLFFQIHHQLVDHRPMVQGEWSQRYVWTSALGGDTLKCSKCSLYRLCSTWWDTYWKTAESRRHTGAGRRANRGLHQVAASLHPIHHRSWYCSWLAPDCSLPWLLESTDIVRQSSHPVTPVAPVQPSTCI